MQVYRIDLSMEKFDVNFIDAKGKERNREMKNGVVAVSRYLSTVPRDGILCAEHTGVYGDLLVYLCNQLKVPIALVPGYSMKHSLGLVKGKEELVDNRIIIVKLNTIES